MIKSIKFNDYQFGDWKADFEMELNGDLNVLLGMNGSGKTVVMDCLFETSLYGYLLTTLKAHKISLEDAMEPISEVVATLNNPPFKNPEIVSGGFTTIFADEKGRDFLAITLDSDKKALEIEVLNEEIYEKEMLPKPIFVNTEANSIDAVKKYCKMKELLGVKGEFDIFLTDNFNKLGTVYKVRDILMLEMLAQYIKTELDGVTLRDYGNGVLLTLFGEFLNTHPILSKGDKDELKFRVDENFCEGGNLYIENGEGDKIPLESLSAGEQRMLFLYFVTSM